MIITIDGPSGAGKSTIARLVAEKLNFEYLDTGAMYRSICLFLINNNIDIESQNEVDKLVKSDDFEKDFNLVIDGGNIYINNINVSEEIRSEIVNENVSKVSSYKSIRDLLVSKQRLIAKNTDIVLDGRDTGSVVFPQADYKFYLTASLEERAWRRYEENRSLDYEDVLESIRRRDYKDSNRKISPLKVPDNAIIIDSTDLSISETAEKIINHIALERN